MQQRNKPTQTRLDPALSLVECSVRVSATLARLMRKCATLEASGTSAQDALLASAGFQAGEIEALRTRAKQSEEELKLAREREAQLQLALDQAKTTIAQRDKELKATRQTLNKTAETEKGSRQSIEGFDRQITDLQLAVAAYKEKLTRTISTDGVGEDALAVLSIFRDRLARGEGISEAALGTAGYSPPDVEAAIAKQGRHEMRAFDALLARSSWRQRLVLWLLGATNKR
jgi:septal ring factor EnvC (AmiA/AmiB activator)